MRIIITSLFFLAGAASASAQDQQTASPALLEQVYACAGTADEAQRLACYDEAVGRLRQAQTSGQIVAVDRQQVETIERESFGFSLPSLPRLFSPNLSGEREPIEAMQLEVARVQRRELQGALIHMTNGQVWEVIGSGRNRNVRPGAMVEVRRGVLGGFLLYAEEGAALRVERRR